MATPTVDSDPALPSDVPPATLRRLRAARAGEGRPADGRNGRLTRWRHALLGTGGLRMLAIGAAAGALTYAIGKLLGVSLT